MLAYLQLHQSSKSFALSKLMALYLSYWCHTVHFANWRWLSSKSVTVIPFIIFGCIYYGSCFISLSHLWLTDNRTITGRKWICMAAVDRSFSDYISKQTLLTAYSISGTRTFHPLKWHSSTLQNTTNNWTIVPLSVCQWQSLHRVKSCSPVYMLQ